MLLCSHTHTTSYIWFSLQFSLICFIRCFIISNCLLIIRVYDSLIWVIRWLPCTSVLKIKDSEKQKMVSSYKENFNVWYNPLEILMSQNSMINIVNMNAQIIFLANAIRKRKKCYISSSVTVWVEKWILCKLVFFSILQVAYA